MINHVPAAFSCQVIFILALSYLLGSTTFSPGIGFSCINHIQNHYHLTTDNTSTPNEEKVPAEMSKAKVFENGPVRVLGPCEILMPDGTTVIKPNGISFCRCGASANMPFCDASHKTNGFQSK